MRRVRNILDSHVPKDRQKNDQDESCHTPHLLLLSMNMIFQRWGLEKNPIINMLKVSQRLSFLDTSPVPTYSTVGDEEKVMTHQTICLLEAAIFVSIHHLLLP